MKKIIQTSLFLFLCIFIGAGCKGKSTTSNTPTTTPEIPVVDTTLQQDAYLFCTKKGYTIQIRFIPGENKNIAYCVFDESHECESVSFMKGKCNDETTATSTEEDTLSMFEPGLNDKFPLRLCEPIADPVCGKDNKTYTNPCIARFLNINIAHRGICEREEVAEDEEIDTPPTLSDTPIIEIAKAPIAALAKKMQTNKNKNWIEIPSSLLKSSTDKNSTLLKCERNNATTFLVKTGCPANCFSTLYDAGGEVICYPGHDMSGTCPEYINSSEYKNSCTSVKS